MNKFVKSTISCLFVFAPCLTWAQTKDTITLEQCHKLALDVSSIGERQNLALDIALSQKKVAGSAYTPSAYLNGIVSYQSDVVHVPIPIVKPPEKESYRVTIDIEQFIYDGGVTAKTKKIVASNLKSQQLKLDIEKIALKDKVANLFLNIELLKKNKNIILLQMDIIKTSIVNLQNLEKNGVATDGDIIKLETELLQQQKHLIETDSNRARIVEMLSIMTQTNLSVKTVFVMPSYDFNRNEVSNRPEFKLFDAQTEEVEWQKKLSKSDNIPKISAFVTGGNGLPGLNMLSSTPEWYYIVGARLSVPLTNWKKTKHTVQKYTSQQLMIQAEKNDFARNNKIAISSNISEIDKFRELITSDEQIIAKKLESLKIEQQKLDNGITTTNDYITELNGYKSALLSQNLNEIKLIEAIINYKSNIGEN